MSTTAGMLASRAWLSARALRAPTPSRWNVNIVLAPGSDMPGADFDERTDTRLRIEIYADEWGFQFCHAGEGSWIRITDIPFVHGRDDFGLLELAPALKDMRAFVRRIERDHGVELDREHAYVRTNLPDAEPSIREWLRSL